jgi:thioredoxin-like negative regulator of GroEL
LAALDRTVALGDTPFLEEARFALAKAHLRRGELEAAHDQLVEVVALDGDRLDEARTLLVRVEESGGGSS